MEFWLSLLFGAIILEDGNDRYQTVRVLEVAVPVVSSYVVRHSIRQRCIESWQPENISHNYLWSYLKTETK